MIEILDLSAKSISRKVHLWIVDLSKMLILILKTNNLEGEILIQNRYLQKLQILNLAINTLSGSIPQYLLNLSTLSSEDITSYLSTILKYGN